jgi:hypothetical protein
MRLMNSLRSMPQSKPLSRVSTATDSGPGVGATLSGQTPTVAAGCALLGVERPSPAQKSGLSAIGTADFRRNSSGFWAHTNSGHSPEAGR